MTATVTTLADAQATLDVLAAGHVGTVYIGQEPTAAGMARDLDAYRAVLTVTGGCPSRDALEAERRGGAPLEERWRPVVGIAGYEVSDLGGVRSIPREVARKDGTTARLAGRVLRMPAPTQGAVRLQLSVAGKVRVRLVHQLVLEAFVGPRPPGHEVAHWDGDETNNRLSNLRYATHAENMADSRRLGEAARGSAVHGAKLTADDVLEIVRLAVGGASHVALAAKFGVSGWTIGGITCGKEWTWLTKLESPIPRKHKTECVAGHPYDEANTRYRSNGTRRCGACYRDRNRARRAALKELAEHREARR